MPSSGIDLHTHSTISDGTDSPTELVQRAVDVGLRVVALTDHDTFDGLAEAVAAGERLGVEVLRGVEISCRRGDSSVHLLGYGVAESDPDLAAELARIRDGRENRLPRLLARLSELGLPLTEAEVRGFAGDSPSVGRPHVADAMVARGYVADRTEAFDRWLSDDGPAHVERYAAAVEDGIRLVHGAGGVAVIAHPWGRGSRSVLGPEVLAELVSGVGLDGFEVDHVDHGPPGSAVRAELRALADSLGALGTGSSDYHGTGKPDLPLGANTTSPEVYADLLRRLR
ncbi:phosphatase [Enemella evansiae]|uniref:PHP domain-containing protein n=1 Tax=Enemella evansiae TaxID=2016499 RepID=UPI000B961B5C|nr:PHP domain-containing protein [Enemella evansiae]OYO05109.1 phosphatase [Enemella evansiae]